jgi:hypothetical protein
MTTTWTRERVWNFLTNGNSSNGVPLSHKGKVLWTISKAGGTNNNFYIKHYGGKVCGMVGIEVLDRSDELFNLVGRLFVVESGTYTHHNIRFVFKSVPNGRRALMSCLMPWSRQPRSIVPTYTGIEGESLFLERQLELF